MNATISRASNTNMLHFIKISRNFDIGDHKARYP